MTDHKTEMKQDGMTISFNAGTLQKLNIIQSGWVQCCFYRDDGRDPSQELLDDIAAYEAILNSPKASERAERYFEIKATDRTLRPRQIAKLAGWLDASPTPSTHEETSLQPTKRNGGSAKTCPGCGYPWSDHVWGENGSSVCEPKVPQEGKP